jgi:predicted ester cyclase
MRALGPGGYRAIIDEWLTAFPDTQVTVVRIESSGEHRFRANLITRGHRDGILEVAPGITVPGDQQPFEVTVVHEFEIRDGKIAAAVALFDRDDLVGGKPRYRGGDPPG